MGRVEALLCDFDGTIADSKWMVVASFRQTIESFGMQWTTESIEATKGLPLIEGYRMLTGMADVTMFCRRHDEIQRDLLPQIKAFPGVVEVLEEIKASGLRVALVTARTKGTRKMMEAMEIENLIDCVVTGNDVANHKPDPEGVNKALTNLRVSPRKAMMVGDADLDIRAGKKAGVVATVGVTYGAAGETIRECKPDHIIDSFGELRDIIRR